MVCGLAGQLRADNLFVNGDFEQGNTGFSTGYGYAPGADPYGNGQGHYTITTDPAPWNNAFASYGDHTTGSGSMMLVDGCTTSDTLVWGETVTVVPLTTYDFSTWISNAYLYSPTNAANLVFELNGSPFSCDAPSTPGVWEQFSTQWYSGTATSLTAQIYDTNTQYDGNDFALDDISITATVPEPSTFVLLCVGAIGLTAWAWRRKRTA